MLRSLNFSELRIEGWPNIGFGRIRKHGFARLHLPSCPKTPPAGPPVKRDTPAAFPRLLSPRRPSLPAMALPECTEEELQALYEWVDSVPLSRPKKSIARDFADGGGPLGSSGMG